MPERNELPDETYAAILRLSERSEALIDRDQYDKAVAVLEEAVALLPAPKEIWAAWTWLTTAIGDAYYLTDRFAEARLWFRAAVAGPDGLGNPFTHFRLGQIARRLGDHERALDELLRAYMGDGEEIFEDDQDDLDFLRSRVTL